MKAKKSLGQNFLWHRGTLEKIMAAAKVKPGEEVWEVGPGKGFLTEALLAKGARVTAVEIDEWLVSFLKEKFKNNAAFTLLHGDALKITPPQAPYKVVANLPYYITSPLLNHFLKDQPPSRRPTDLVVMVQKEVAEKIDAKAGKMSVLAVNIQLFGTPKRIIKVPASHFKPAPKVDSAVVHIQVKPSTLDEQQVEALTKMLHAGFAHKRKKLIRNLEGLKFKKEALKNAFQTLSLTENTRAEELSVEQWVELAILMNPLW